MARPLEIGNYFGAIGEQNDFAEAVFTRVTHRGELALPAHRHELPYFCLLLRGSYVEEVEGRRLEYSPFSVGFHPPVIHRDWIGPVGDASFCIEIRSGWLAAAAQLLPTDPDLEPRLLEGDLSCLVTQLYRLHAEEVLGPETVDSALWELVGCLWRSRHLAERGHPGWLAACLDLLRGEFSRPLTVMEVASAVDVHPVHLSREFRRRFGQTMGEYVNKLRIQSSCGALEELERPLTEIALAAGFADHSHFGRVFKSRIGCTPGRFRKLLGSG